VDLQPQLATAEDVGVDLAYGGERALPFLLGHPEAVREAFRLTVPHHKLSRLVH
jgi:hypothetical protein